ncbi:MAG: glycogen synthase GlgA [Oscillospiraceae bacterium]|jgi:starch synthase|nr:glycogen synthase GlgA [Oscillospiraceae bacterium]
MKILFVTSEAAPFAKTGGLADVMGALPATLSAKRAGVRVMMPLYDCIAEEYRKNMKLLGSRYIKLGWRSVYCGLFELKLNGVVFYFIDNEYYFKRGELYGHFDDGERFAFFSRAAAELAQNLPENWRPDIVHCHDWQTALTGVYLRTEFSPAADDIKLIFTIHNIEYQGRYSRHVLGDVFGLPDSLFNGGTMEFCGGLNLMKAAIEMSDAVTTVSPTYADELSYAFYAHGLEGVIQNSRHKMRGILNGIDTAIYDPATDPDVFENYDALTLEKKAANKTQLQKILGLTPQKKVPLIGMVTRLVSHKGLDLVAASLDAIMDIDAQFVVVGRGDWNFEQHFRNAGDIYKGRFSAQIMYSPSLASKVYAGADIFLMPSKSEPCGLTQMIAMRYGTVPVTRETGGLRDTVTPYIAETKQGRGFTFANYNAQDMVYVLRSAAELYRSDPKAWRALAASDMGVDFSWTQPAAQYMAMYREVSGKK